jgi:hypothetical protein
MIALDDQVQGALSDPQKVPGNHLLLGQHRHKKRTFLPNSAGSKTLIRVACHILTKIRVVAAAVRNAG